jgi:hypothetical protein
MFVIVEFFKEPFNEIATAPMNWLDINNKTCKWPPYLTENAISKAKKLKEIPSKSWKTHTYLRVFKRIFSNTNYYYIKLAIYLFNSILFRNL